MKGFKDFILRGNVVDLAVAVIIGVAFGTVVTALVKDIITPIVAAFGGQPDFSQLAFRLNHSTFRYGDFIDAVIAFLIIAAVVYFFVVKPVNALLARARTDAGPDSKECAECLSKIPIAARRCAYCTVEQPAG